MRFKFDENLPAELASMLVQKGHDAHSVHDENLGGATDEAISAACRDEQRILITLDLDFADIRRYPPREHAGIIVLRLERQDREAVLALLQRILALLETEEVNGRLWIVDEMKTRIRGD